MENQTNSLFNPAPPTIMHVDLNSCFATVEQQANPLLRGKPVVVAAYVTSGGCVLAASREAKTLGIKTGMRVGEAKAICKTVIVLPSDPWKYRFINRKLLALFSTYTPDVEVKSIDEMVLNFQHTKENGYIATLLHCLTKQKSKELDNNITKNNNNQNTAIQEIMILLAQEIKERIKKEIGEWLTVSVGIAPNRYLAKIAACLHKPDGLDEIHKDNIEVTLGRLKLEDLTGIKTGYGSRLRFYGIDSALAFYHASPDTLGQAFHSIMGSHWWKRLHGWEVDDRAFATKSFGQSYALYKPYVPSDVHTHQILCQLVEKMGRRLRAEQYTAQGIHVSCLFRDYSFWHKGRKLADALFAGSDLYQASLHTLHEAPDKPVRILAVSCHYLDSQDHEQRKLFVDDEKKRALARALDHIHDRYGEFTVMPARMLAMEHKIMDRIAFGGVKDLEGIGIEKNFS